MTQINESGVHQCAWTCKDCGEDGLSQTVAEPKYCSSCGSDNIEVDLIEFTILEGVPKSSKPSKPRGYRVQPSNAKPRGTRVIYKRKNTVYCNALYLKHNELEEGEEIKVELLFNVRNHDGTLRKIYRMNCGYAGQRTAAFSHLTTIHKVPREKALEMLKIRNCAKAEDYEYLDNPERLRLYPYLAEKLGIDQIEKEK